MGAMPGLMLQAAPVQTVNLNEAGRVLATLDDWRSLMFVQLTVIGVLVLMLMGLVIVIVRMAGKRSANDQATLQALTDSTKALGELAASVRAVEVIAARRESEQR